MPVRIEVCVDSAVGTWAVERTGADRAELCGALIVGGLTPSIGTVLAAVSRVERIGVHVLIRPRDGDFVFSPTEIDVMLADIERVQRETAGAAVDVGFVIGALTDRFEIDRAVTAELATACGAAPITFHRAFDLTENLDRSLDALIDLGITRVLTGGGVQRALEGAPTLARLVERAAGRIVVMPGGSVRPDNAAALVAATGASELHFRPVTPERNLRPPHRAEVRMSSRHAPDEDHREVTSEPMISEMLAAVAPLTPEPPSRV